MTKGSEMSADDPMREILQNIVHRLVAGYAPQRIILFGSRVYGEPNEDSDIDLLVIKDTTQRPLERWIEVKRLLRDLSCKVAISPLVYTPQEIEKRLAIGDFFIQEILEKGKVLYG